MMTIILILLFLLSVDPRIIRIPRIIIYCIVSLQNFFDHH